MRIKKIFVVFFLFLAAAVTESSTTAAAPKPNIVIILSDDQSSDDLSCVSKSGPHTTALDALAASGMRFANAYVTSPQCSSSRASILTGRSPHTTGTTRLHTPLTPEFQSVLEPLKQRGYYTGALCKVHLGEIFQSRWDFYKNEVHAESFFEHRPKDRPFFL